MTKHTANTTARAARRPNRSNAFRWAVAATLAGVLPVAFASTARGDEHASPTTMPTTVPNTLQALVAPAMTAVPVILTDGPDATPSPATPAAPAATPNGAPAPAYPNGAPPAPTNAEAGVNPAPRPPQNNNANGGDPSANVGFTPPATVSSPMTGLIESGVDAQGKLAITMNKTAVLTTHDKTARVSVSQPDVADVTLVGPTTILVTAKKPGMCQVIVWNDKDQSQSVDVSVGVDLIAMREEFKKDFPDANIGVDLTNGTVTLRGRVPNLKIAEQAGRIASAYTPAVLNFLEVGGGQQIVLKVQFIELSRAASLQLGFNSFFSDGSNFRLGFQNGGVSPNPIGALAFGNKVDQIPSAATIFGSGSLGGATVFETFVNALKTNNLARTLAEPNLVSVSGEDASFLAGGEIPIPVPQAGVGGASTITIEYKEFGVRLKYNAVVLGDGRVRIKLEPEISDLDYNNSTSVGGRPVPGLRTRKASSVIEMAEGQTLAMAGLLQRSVNSRYAGTPLLADLPIVGAFFRNVEYTRSETELVLLVTPSLVSAMNPDQIPVAPGDRFRYPNEAQLYGLGDLGGVGDAKSPVASRRTPPSRFIGPTGFGETPEPVQPATAPADMRK